MNKNLRRTIELCKKRPKIPRENSYVGSDQKFPQEKLSYVRNEQKFSRERRSLIKKKNWTEIPQEQLRYIRNEQKFPENNRVT